MTFGIRLYSLLALVAFAASLTFSQSAWAAKGKGKGKDKAEESEEEEVPIVVKDVCVEPSIVTEMKECPSGAKAFKAKKAKSSGPKAVKAKEIEKKEEQTTPGFEFGDIQDEISAKKKKKAKEIEKAKIDLLKKALKQTRLLVKSMSDDNDKKPVALHQMAEKCFDLQQKYYFKSRALDETLYKAEQAGDPNLVKKVKVKQGQYEKDSEKYRLEAMEYYKILIRDFPDYEARDTVLFNLAYAFDELSKTYPEKKASYAANAREVYYVLIKEYPDSKYIPHAWLSFAEYYFMEGKGDSMGKALKFYKEVTKYPDTSIFSYALYKQSWCLYNMQDYNGTLNKFIDVIEYADQHPEDENAKQLQRQVRKEMHMPYSQVKPPDHAWEFFSRYGGEFAVSGMENLADSYFNQGFWKDAIVIYHKLMAVEPGSDSFCVWQYMVTFATNSLKNKDEQLVELKRMTSAYGKFASESHPQEMKDQCLRDVREMIQNQAFAWHREAVGTDTQPGTNDINTMKRAIETYGVLLKFHDEYTEAWNKVPQTGPEDSWVTPYDIAYYKAELLWNMEDWVKCGPAYDRVVEMNPEGQYMQESAYAAVLCYNRVYHMYHKDDKAKKHDVLKTKKKKGKKGKKKKGDEEDPSQYALKKISSISGKMLDAFTRYTCYVEESDDLPDIMYQKARIYYEANHYQEASFWFKEIAYNHVNSEVGPFAANLYLDSLYGIMLQDKGRSVPCLETIADAANDFIVTAKFEPYMEDPLFKQVVYQLKCNTERKKAEAYQDQKEWKDAAITYKELYEKWGNECDERLDEVLFNMGITFQAANLLGQAIKWRKVLIDKFPDSEHAKKAVYEVGANYHAIAMYEQAANYYEKFSKKYPGEEDAYKGLSNATAFRLGLGQYDKALDDAKAFIKNYTSGKKKKPIEVAKVAFSMGSIYKRQKDWGQVLKHYDKFAKKYKAKGVVDLRIRAYVEMANAWKKKAPKKPEQAMKYYASAAKLFSIEALAQIEGAGETDEEKEADKKTRGGLMLDAGSESLFYQGEKVYFKFTEIKFPIFDPDKIKKVIYSDNPEEAKAQKLLYTNKYYNESKEAWLKHKNLMHFQTWSKTDLKTWAEKKVKAKADAEEIYGQVLDYKVPRWVIASAARLGDMYRQFFDAYYNAPVPDLIKEDPELLDLYNDQRDQDALQYKDKAITGFGVCLEEAKKNQWFNEWSVLCETALAELDPKAFSVSSEMRATATYSKEYVAWPGLDGKLKTKEEKAEEAALTGKGE